MASSVYNLNNENVQFEKERLDVQHKVLTTITDGKLLPDHVLNQLNTLDAPAVADIATGTGCWLEHIAQHLPPSARLDGYDFDVSKFPEHMPRNVTLSYGNFLEPTPKPLHAQYDVVHVRFIVFALKAEQWEIVATNLKPLLKPGGWLVWDETGYHTISSSPWSRTWGEWIRIDSSFATSIGRDIRAPAKLTGQLRRYGYVNCRREIFSSFGIEGDNAWRKTSSTVWANAAKQSMIGIVAKGGYDYIQTVEDVDVLFNKLLAEIQGGCELGLAIWRVAAQKPILT